MKYFNLLVLVGVTLFFLGCKTTGLKIGNLDVGKLVNQGINVWDANNISEEQEVQFGINMSAVLLGTQPLHPNKQINNYVNQVGMWLAINSPRPDLPWRFGVIHSDAINAFAAPGGFVFITSGMLKQLESEAQLAAILAHEIVHVVEQHHLEAVRAGATRNALTETLFISAEAYQGNTNAENKDRQYVTWAKTISIAAQDLYSRGLSREDEYIADQQGMILLAKAGYDVFAFVDNLQILQGMTADDFSLALMYKTHPTPSERLVALEPVLNSFQENKGQLLSTRFKSNVYR